MYGQSGPDRAIQSPGRSRGRLSMNLKQAVLDSQEVWEKIEKGRYGSGARALDVLFDRFPTNDDVDVVYAKVALLNHFYSTMIGRKECFALAKGITRLATTKGLDQDLKEGCRKVVGKVAVASRRLRPKSKDKPKGEQEFWEYYSFATKYCSFHYPEKYPIYDSNVRDELWKRWKKAKDGKGFHEFKEADLRDYKEFCKIIGAFRGYYGLERTCLRKVDRYLWLLGKEMVDIHGKATKKATDTY